MNNKLRLSRGCWVRQLDNSLPFIQSAFVVLRTSFRYLVFSTRNQVLLSISSRLNWGQPWRLCSEEPSLSSRLSPCFLHQASPSPGSLYPLPSFLFVFRQKKSNRRQSRGMNHAKNPFKGREEGLGEGSAGIYFEVSSQRRRSVETGALSSVGGGIGLVLIGRNANLKSRGPFQDPKNKRDAMGVRGETPAASAGQTQFVPKNSE